MTLAFKQYSELLSLVNNVNGTTYDNTGKIVGIDFSDSPLSVSVGTKTVVLAESAGVLAKAGNKRGYKVDDLVLLTAKSGTTATMLGKVLLYTPNNQALSINVLSVTGSGTGTSWRLTKPMPRVDFHPEFKTVRGVRIEPTSFNDFQNSAVPVLSNLSAGMTDSVVTNEIVNPAGNSEVRRLDFVSATNGSFRISGPTPINDVRYCDSVFIRTVPLEDGTNVPRTITLNVGVDATTGDGATSWEIDSTKWYRVHASRVITTSAYLYVNLPAGSYYIYGAQREPYFSTPTSYIPTRLDVESRETDVYKAFDSSILTSVLTDAYTVVVQAEHEVTPEDDGLAYSVATISDGTTDNIISLQLNNQGAASYAARISVVSAGNAVYSHTFDNNTFEIGQRYRMGVVVKLNDFLSAFHNTLGSSDLTGITPTVNDFWIGSTNGTLDQFRGWVSEFYFYPYAATAEQLLELTDTVGTPLIHTL